MANPDHLEILQKGQKAWSRWRKEHPTQKPDLSGAELVEAKLSGANLSYAKLTGSNLNKADLQGADLRGARLQQADLCQANLTGAMLIRSQLQQADLIGTRLCRADLRKANLKRADLLGADLTDADLREAVLSSTKMGGATITGARMYGTLRDDWEIDEIVCEYLYWDAQGRQRTPSTRSFKKREFQSIYADWPDILNHFESRANREGQVQALILKTRKGSDDPWVTPRHLSESIAPYLKTVADLQALLNEYVDLPGPEVHVVSIVCTNSVQVHLDGAPALLAFIQEELAEWRRENKKRLARLARSSNEAELSQKEAQILAIKSKAVSNTFESRMLQAEAAKKQAESKVIASRIQTMTRDVYADLEARLEKKFSFKWISDKSLAEFKQRVLPYLQFLAESDLAG